MTVTQMINHLEEWKNKGFGNLNVVMKDYSTGQMARCGGTGVDVGRICDDGLGAVCKWEDEGLWRECEGAEEVIVVE